MTSGRDAGRGAGLALYLSVAMMLAYPATACADTHTAWGLEQLMNTLRQVKSMSARFVERKYIKLLKRRLDTSGTLRYVAPDRLEKITKNPAPARFVVDGDVITGTQSDGEEYSLALGERPEIAALVEGIRSTLAGDLPTLRRYYIIDFEGTRARWRLKLTPRDQAVLAKVDDIAIEGAAADLETVEVREADGDRSEMVIAPIRR